MKRIIALLLIITAANLSYSQNYTSADTLIFNRYIKEFASKRELPVDELVTQTALFFLGTPYVAHTLEIEPEALTINLSQLDCTTFVESVLALAQTVRSGLFTFENFMEQLRNMRYRNGIIEDYSSRIHYTSEWIFINQKRGVVENITQKIGGEPIEFNLNIISQNPSRYKQLLNNPLLIEKIALTEQRASAYPNYYINKSDIKAKEEYLRDGDIVGFVTTIKGVDLSHVGFIYKDRSNSPKERLTFIHASSGEKKVVVEKLTLEQYALNSKSNKGILAVRPTF